MVKVKNGIIFALAFTLSLIACDDGDVDEKRNVTVDGYKVHLTADVTGLGTWDDDHYVALAAFNDASDYALTTRRITEGDGALDITLSSVNSEATSIELCVLNKLRQRVATFAALEIDEVQRKDQVIQFNVGTLRVSMLAAIQQSVFTPTCSGCHSDNNLRGVPSAGLWLTEGKSHKALVGQPSTKVAGSDLVVAGDAQASVLYRLLTSPEVAENWAYKHVGEVNDTRKLNLIRSWIDTGANE